MSFVEETSTEQSQIVERIESADIILATDRCAKIEFVVFGTQTWENCSGDSTERTLTIERIDVRGPKDVHDLCRLVKRVKGFHEFSSFSNRRRLPSYS